MRYIVLLRGVNVGGKGKLSMPKLKTALAQQGFTDIITYINSGNVLFSSDETDVEKLQAECRALILSDFDIEVPVTVVPAHELVEAMAHAPAWWNRDEASKHNAIFVIPPASAQDVAQQVGEIKPEYEQVATYGQVIFWSAPIKTFSRTRWSKVVGSAAYGSITIRNANTALKLAQLAGMKE